MLTVGGLSPDGRLHPLQQAFIDCGAAQCGYCTPGKLLTAKALLDRNPDPTEEEIREALSGVLCRCTGYVKIVQAVRRAAHLGLHRGHLAFGRRARIDGRADLYSLGATLFQLVTGQVPFPGPSSAVIMSRHLNERPPDPRTFTPELSEGFTVAVLRLLARERERRRLMARRRTFSSVGSGNVSIV